MRRTLSRDLRTGPVAVGSHTIRFVTSPSVQVDEAGWTDRSGERLRVHTLIDSLNWGGAETLLAEYAIGAERAGIELSVAYLHDRPGVNDRLRELGIEPVLVPVSGLLSRAGRRRVRDHLAALSPDLLHSHLGYSDVYGGLAARSLGIPAVATLHTMAEPPGPREHVKERLMGLARRHCAQRVIAVSDALRDAYLARRWDTPERVVTVRNGILGDIRPGAGTRVRAELGVSDDALVVGMVSVLRAGKGHDIAAAAVAALREDFPQLRLLVLGTGPDREEIGRQLEPLGDGAIMAGHRDDVLEAIDAMDVLIHPSLIDALPTALIEAMAASTPVVATAVGGIPEIVVPGETGVLIGAPPTAAGLADALRPLLADPGFRRRLGEAGRGRFMAEFTVDSWMQRLLPVYRDAIAAVASRRRSAGARSGTTGR